jgi:anti-anti-sigma factor
MNVNIHSHPIGQRPNPVVPVGIRSLMRGAETKLLEEIMPLVRHQSVWLDLSCVDRIDAAGLAALIALYRAACEGGHRFGVKNPAPHVREILSLVGLDRFLMNEDSAEVECLEMEVAQTAA